MDCATSVIESSSTAAYTSSWLQTACSLMWQNWKPLVGVCAWAKRRQSGKHLGSTTETRDVRTRRTTSQRGLCLDQRIEPHLAMTQTVRARPPGRRSPRSPPPAPALVPPRASSPGSRRRAASRLRAAAACAARTPAGRRCPGAGSTQTETSHPASARRHLRRRRRVPSCFSGRRNCMSCTGRRTYHVCTGQ